MSIAIHQVFLVPVIHQLNNLKHILQKAHAHCAIKHIDPQVMLSVRLFPDMFALTKQVQIATDMVKAAGGRLTGTDFPRFADDEQSFEALITRVDQVITYLQGLPTDAFMGAEARPIHLSLPNGRELDFDGLSYLNHWVLPNFYFHMTTAYNLLRHNGVELVKRDFLGG